MPKLPILSGQELVKILSRAGFEIKGQKGSHVKMKRQLADRVIVTTVPLHRALDTGTLLGILKQAEITRDQLFELMQK